VVSTPWEGEKLGRSGNRGRRGIKKNVRESGASAIEGGGPGEGVRATSFLPKQRKNGGTPTRGFLHSAYPCGRKDARDLNGAGAEGGPLKKDPCTRAVSLLKGGENKGHCKNE